VQGVAHAPPESLARDVASAVLALDVLSPASARPSVAVDPESVPPSLATRSGDAAHDANVHGSASAAHPIVLAARMAIAFRRLPWIALEHKTTPR